MKLEHEVYGKIAVINIDGGANEENLAPLRQLINDQLQAETRDFVLDLTRVDFLDSAALELMLWLQEQADERMGQVRLVGPSETVAEILRITRLDKQFDAHDQLEGALKSLK